MTHIWPQPAGGVNGALTDLKTNTLSVRMPNSITAFGDLYYF